MTPRFSPFTKRVLPLIAVSLATSTAVSTAATSFISGDLGTAANWSNGLPGTGNNGTIAANGTLGSISIAGGGSVTVTHSSGTIGTSGLSDDGSITTSGGTSLIWNQTGGTVQGNTSGTRQFFVSTGVTYNFSGGLIDFGTTGGSRLIAQSGGDFNMTGGVMRDGGAQTQTAGSDINLTGGSFENFTRGFEISPTLSLINVGGSFSITSANASLTAADYVQGLGSLVFSPSWTGYFSDPGTSTWTSAEWITALTPEIVMVGSTEVTAANFDSLFKVDASGNLSLVPEPSIALLGGLGLLGLLRRRRA